MIAKIYTYNYYSYTLCLFQSNELQIASDKYWYKQQTMKNIDHKKRKTKVLRRHKFHKTDILSDV